MIQALPDDIVLLIMQHLIERCSFSSSVRSFVEAESLASIITVSHVCKTFRRLTRDLDISALIFRSVTPAVVLSMISQFSNLSALVLHRIPQLDLRTLTLILNQLPSSLRELYITFTHAYWFLELNQRIYEPFFLRITELTQHLHMLELISGLETDQDVDYDSLCSACANLLHSLHLPSNTHKSCRLQITGVCCFDDAVKQLSRQFRQPASQYFHLTSGSRGWL